MKDLDSRLEALIPRLEGLRVMVVGDLILIVGILGVMFYHSWRLSLILVAYIPVIIILVLMSLGAVSLIFMSKT